MNDFNSNEIVKNIQENEIQILKFSLNNNGDFISLDLNFNCNGKTYSGIFYRIESLCLENICTPFIVYGFQIFDNKKRGWENDKRYYIEDYEDGKLSFNCEDFYLWEDE